MQTKSKTSLEDIDIAKGWKINNMSYFCDENEDTQLGKRPNFRYIMKHMPSKTSEQGSSADENDQVRPSAVLFRNLKRVRHTVTPEAKSRPEAVRPARPSQPSQRQFYEQYRNRYLDELHRYKSQMDYFN